ncbi:hypothetical Protein YC6258_05827 [Gynuella sunshinyii YC6258]|uniref:Rhs family protein n=2 Tax=Gynuella sunshinyii TaxID=1445505 RepID=A0A0C5VF16_9GAMM|nr:hypothetical Protein YC6258_05827 [Gynuella sunshinyii YC6258]
MVTDASGQMVWSKDYDPYGNEGRVTGDGDTRELTFHHHQRIADAGLVYVGATVNGTPTLIIDRPR